MTDCLYFEGSFPQAQPKSVQVNFSRLNNLPSETLYNRNMYTLKFTLASFIQSTYTKILR